MASQSNDVDFIGQLPDCVLHRIISLLPYKEAARIATLGPRWHRLLPRERVVDVDDTTLGLAGEIIANYSNAIIDKLSVTLTRHDTAPEAALPLLSFSAAKKSKAVLLEFSGAELDLPLGFYENPCLETLKLHSCRFEAARFAGLAESLTELSLESLELNKESLETLMQECWSLKSLRLRKCRNARIFVVKSGVLERLTIEDCETDMDSWVSLETANLKSLKYTGSLCTFDVYVTERLEEAVLDFGNDSETEVGHLLVELFKDHYIDPLKVLTVCSFMLQAVTFGDKPWGIRRGLRAKHLILKATLHENEFFGIRFFLNTCYRLERLTVEVDPSRRIIEDYESPFEGHWGRLPIYECVKRTLKVVNVKGYRGNTDEFRLLAYFVLAGGVMEELNVEMKCRDSQVTLQVARMLQAQPKASANLRISVSFTE